MNEYESKVKQDKKKYPFKHNSQCDKILRYLLTGKKLKNYEMREKFSSLAHNSRINEIRKQGFHIQSYELEEEKGVWVYFLSNQDIELIKQNYDLRGV